MPISFPFFRQRDAMDCGPACLMMVAAAHGRKYPLPYLREHSHLSREGVSAQGIMDAAETVGFRTIDAVFSQMTVQFLQSRILLFVGTRINVAMVSDFLAKLMRLPIGYFDTRMTGDLMQRIGDQARIEAFLTQSALPVLFSAVNFVIFGLVLLAYNITIFGIFGIAALLYVGWILFFLRRRKAIDYLRFQQSGENNNTVIEMIQGMQEIKLQGSERKRRWIWAGVQARLFHTKVQALHLAQWQEAGAGFINQSKNILIAFIAAKLHNPAQSGQP